MVSGMTSGFKMIINHIFVKILTMIDKYVPSVLTLNNQVNIYMSKRLSIYELFMWYIYVAWSQRVLLDK